MNILGTEVDNQYLKLLATALLARLQFVSQLCFFRDKIYKLLILILKFLFAYAINMYNVYFKKF